MLAPIVLFGFVRKDTLKEVIAGLKKNTFASQSDLYIFIDGPRKEEDKPMIVEVCKFCNGIDGFRNITIRQNKENKGLDPSIIAGVSEIINKYQKVIVLEDDVVPAPNFLAFMNACLAMYENDPRIMTISGWGVRLSPPDDYDADVYMLGRSSSWGWATWKDRWDSIDWKITDWESFRHSSYRVRQFNKYGGDDMFHMLKQCMNGGNMWDIRLCYNMFLHKKYSIVPFMSKTDNIGYNDLATHCKPEKYKRFEVDIDTTYQTEFRLPVNICPDKRIISQRLKISSNYHRLKIKLLNFLFG